MLGTQKLDPQIHNRKAFDCGVPALNTFLQTQANNAAKRSLSKTFVLIDSDHPEEIIGYYTLSFAEIIAPTESKLSSYPHPLPALKLSRMAVSQKFRGNRFGEQLLIEIIAKTARTAEAESLAPVIGLFVDPKVGAASFYKKYGFLPASADDESREMLWLPISSCVQVASELI
jgi:GNAT superfamily N-acetyltransferase